jgi:hypothetical protein
MKTKANEFLILTLNNGFSLRCCLERRISDFSGDREDYTMRK